MGIISLRSPLMFWLTSLSIFSCVTVLFPVHGIANAQNIPQGQCIQNAFGEQKCGYNCVRNAFGEMACADWPGGKCTQNAFGEQQCGPPAPRNWSDSYTNRSD